MIMKNLIIQISIQLLKMRKLTVGQVQIHSLVILLISEK